MLATNHGNRNTFALILIIFFTAMSFGRGTSIFFLRFYLKRERESELKRKRERERDSEHEHGGGVEGEGEGGRLPTEQGANASSIPVLWGYDRS